MKGNYVLLNALNLLLNLVYGHMSEEEAAFIRYKESMKSNS